LNTELGTGRVSWKDMTTANLSRNWVGKVLIAISGSQRKRKWKSALPSVVSMGGAIVAVGLIFDLLKTLIK
jgi:hypothetical protein